MWFIESNSLQADIGKIHITALKLLVPVGEVITGLPYTAIPVGKWVEFLRFIFFRVGKSLACHPPGKWCLCA